MSYNTGNYNAFQYNSPAGLVAVLLLSEMIGLADTLRLPIFLLLTENVGLNDTESLTETGALADFLFLSDNLDHVYGKILAEHITVNEWLSSEKHR